MKKKIAILIFTILISAVGCMPAKAAEQPKVFMYGLVSQSPEFVEAQKLVNEALKDRTFYKYNIAFSNILKVKDEVGKNKLLVDLGSISNEIFTKDILHYNERLGVVASTGDGKVYDELEVELRNSTINPVDKEYLLGELTSWGRQKVYTSDYTYAVDRIIDAWNVIKDSAKIEAAIARAEEAVNLVSNAYGKKYLLEQIQSIKDKVFKSTDIVEDFNSMISNKNLMSRQQLDLIVKFAEKHPELNLPQNFLSGTDGLVFADALFKTIPIRKENGLSGVSNNVTSAILSAESFKFKGQAFSGVPAVYISANKETSVIDITGSVIGFTRPLSEGTTYKLVSAKTKLNSRLTENISEHIYIGDNKVYIKPVGVTSDTTVYINYTVNYNGVNRANYITLVIKP